MINRSINRRSQRQVVRLFTTGLAIDIFLIQYTTVFGGA